MTLGPDPLVLAQMADREAIARLKFTYVRAVDENDWETVAKCFVPEATSAYGVVPPLDGRDAIVSFLQQATVARSTTQSAHRVTQPMIDFDDSDHATGTWVLTDTLVHEAEGTMVDGVGDYHDCYVRTPDGWRIAHTGYVRRYVLRRSL